jgi:hypothetical protein
VAAVWIPLAAALTPANEADNAVAPALIAELPEELRIVLGDLHYNAPNVQEACEYRDYWLITPHYGSYPHDDEGKEVRRIFHRLRHQAIENFNEQFKTIFDVHQQVPLGAVLLYQLALFYRFERQLDLRVGMKAFLKAA